MRTNFISIKEIKTPIKLSAKLYLYDVLFIAAYAIAFYQLRFLVSEYLETLYLLLCIIWGLFFTIPSRMNKGKRNWQTLFLFLIRRKACYRDVSDCKKLPKGEKTL